MKMQNIILQCFSYAYKYFVDCYIENIFEEHYDLKFKQKRKNISLISQLTLEYINANF